MKTLLSSILCALSLVSFAPALTAANNPFDSNAEIGSLDELLELVKQGRIEQSKSNQQREQRFLGNQSTQQSELDNAISQRKALELESEKLEADYDARRQELNKLTQRLETRMGSLSCIID